MDSTFLQKSAGCSPASSSVYLELNNVSALIHSGGNLWQIRAQNRSQYEIPKGSGIMSLFASALWLGGLDVNGQLKLAALRYRDGNDYWTGPLSNEAAEVTTFDCLKYDRFYQVKQDEIKTFDAWYNAGLYDAENGTNTQNENFPDYEIPEIIKEWPAHGDLTQNQDHFLAPFYDRNGDMDYNYLDGDYPWYDFKKDVDCQTDRTVTLFGDETNWWVMNDKGNIHTETGSDPIGMEVRAQAFGFTTNDEINNMTFYNYELINRSTQTLYNTYFGVFVDVALGGPNDDYVGCDVGRGLGYAYNGNEFDATESGFLGYGSNPPAVGVDFFEGPYQDNDLIDNAIGIGPNEAVEGNGIGFGDGIVDNERFGMRRFLYYNNLGGGNINQTDPITAGDYYSYLRGYWKDGTRFVYGGSGHFSDANANASIECDFMFPGDTDPLGWGTGGNVQPSWTEQSAGNFPFDRRFAQSAGPFKLDPGAVNNITVGVVWARARSGNAFASVVKLQQADDKAQALFENCFKVLEGPNAPDLNIQEMENELIFTLQNPLGSNNFNEQYQEANPLIIIDSTINGDNIYRFQGYQVYQVKNETVSVSDIGNLDLARIAFQCDIKDDVKNLVNYTIDIETEVQYPEIKVQANNEGIKHSFSIKKDLFAQGEDDLINHKQYHYIAIAYSSNNFKDYDPLDANSANGQKVPYLSSRKGPFGEIRVVSGIPHKPNIEAGGTEYSSNYGDFIAVTKVDGIGNGPNWLSLSTASEDAIISNGSIDEIEYTADGSPIKIKIIDPLNIPNADFVLKFLEDNDGDTDSSSWFITNSINSDTIFSESSITIENEQLLVDWGISIEIVHSPLVCRDGAANCQYNDQDVWPIGSRLSFADSSKQWLGGYYDDDRDYPSNWILSGNNIPPTDPGNFDPFYIGPLPYKDIYDENELYEDLIGGSFAPFYLTNYNNVPGSVFGTNSFNITYPFKQTLAQMNNIDIVFTQDKSKWTRCPVIELGSNQSQTENGGEQFALRKSKSIDKSGKIDGEPGYNASEGNLISNTGMGWFPGYAIDLDKGERLNIIYGENSWLAGENGRDMVWNPSASLGSNGQFLNGGMHVLYFLTNHESLGDITPFDNGEWAYNQLVMETNGSHLNVFNKVNWVGYPMLNYGQELLSNEARIELRISRPFEKFEATNENNTLPMYKFSLSNFSTSTGEREIVASVLDEINIVPNPYYGYSSYEANKIDTRTKIVNLPEACEISIYNVRGKLIKRIKKDNPLTYQDWDLKNHKGIPIAGGVYLVHVSVPEIGERVLKTFIGMREVNFENF